MYDFKRLADDLLPQSHSLVPQWIPGGAISGNEYKAGSIRGGQGSSFSVNLNTGLWAEFASDDLKGGDLISLFAKINGISNGEAYERLGGPVDPTPRMKHPKHGLPAASWTYRDAAGNPIAYVARYNTPEGKEFLPWRRDGDHWACKGLPAPRPLYGLDLLAERPEAPVLVCEGEKAAEAARLLAPQFVVITWPNGAKAWPKADWQPVYGRKVVLWPDADEPGRVAMAGIAGLLASHCPAIKILERPGMTAGWDAADAVASGMLQPALYDWIKTTNVFIFKQENNVSVHVDVRPADDTPEPSLSQYAMIEKLGLALSNGKPIGDMANISLFLDRSEYAGHVWYDTFHQRLFASARGEPKHAWADIDTLRLTEHLQKNIGFRRLSDEIVYKAVSLYGQSNARNEPRDWLQALVWDQKPRISSFFCDYLGAELSPYTLAVGHNFWVSMVARVFRPGCQMDHMVVLEAQQNAGKTSALRIIGGDWYAEMSESIHNKDFFMVLKGRILVEIAELDSFNKAEVNRIKQVISCPIDPYRKPYAKEPMDYPRTSIFCGTTNDDAYLKDATGGRRFWPIKCGVIDLPGIRLTREQLFAEAVALYREDTPWHLTPELETKEMQESRRDPDAWEGILESELKLLDRITISEAGALVKITIDKLDLRLQHRIGKCLKKIGFVKKVLRNEGVSQKTWVREGKVADEIGSI